MQAYSNLRVKIYLLDYRRIFIMKFECQIFSAYKFKVLKNRYHLVQIKCLWKVFATFDFRFMFIALFDRHCCILIRLRHSFKFQYIYRFYSTFSPFTSFSPIIMLYFTVESKCLSLYVFRALSACQTYNTRANSIKPKQPARCSQALLI